MQHDAAAVARDATSATNTAVDGVLASHVPPAAAPAAPALPGALGLLLTRAAPSDYDTGAAVHAASPTVPWPAATGASPAAAVLPASAGAGAAAANTSAAVAGHSLPLNMPAASSQAVAAGGGTAGPGAAARPPRGSEAAASSSSGAKQPRAVASSTGAVPAAAPAGAVGADGTSQLGVEDVEEGMCVVCWAAKRRVLMWPCRHLCCCSQCSVVLQAQGAPCPMYRQDVRDHLEIYM
jgi:hypothetical protein